MVDNPEILGRLYPRERALSAKGDGDPDLLIITGAPFDSVFQRLAGWKRRCGLVTKVVLTDSIYSAAAGIDRQEKIRNYIKEQVQAHGTGYVILGGDTAVVPARVAFAAASGYDSLAPGRDSLRADLYYGDLDGNWNGDGDGVWGEIEDSVDMYPDVIVGRAPVNTLADAQTFVRKATEYQQGAQAGFLDRASLWAEMLDPVSDGAAAAEIIDRDHLTGFFKPAEKLYETLGNQTRASTIEAYRQGRHLMNHIGHAWYTSMNVGPGFTSENEIRAGDFDTIPTGGQWGIIYSIGCMPAAIERNCIAERFVNSPQGGGVAFIGNCSYGWSLPYFPGYASSDLYDQQFFRELLVDEAPTLGLAHAAAKARFIARSQAENEYRWVMFDLNLLGDPALPVWTAGPETLDVSCPDSLCSGCPSVPVSVRSNGSPVSGAVVTLIGDSVYARGTADGSGTAVFAITAYAGDSLTLTATARNRLPFVKRIPVFDSGAQLSLLARQAAETSGNGDGHCGPGETVSLSFLIKNSGSDELGDTIYFALSRSDSASVLFDSAFAMTAPAPGESLWTGPAFSFLADSVLDDGDVPGFLLTVSDSSGRSWSFPAGVPLAAPRPVFAGYSVDDRSGNGNGVPEPGESVVLHVNIANKGRAALQAGTAHLSTGDPFVALTDSTDSLGTVLPDSAAKASFTAYIDPGMPGPSRSSSFNLECRYSWKAWRDSFPAALGQVGFADDMESGSPGWRATAPESTEGGWHLSQVRSHSSDHSWYFGSEADSLMPGYSLDTLETPAFTAGPSCSLAYWQWHSFTPGWSWGVAEICGEFGARLLEVAEGQSGGWRHRQYDLSSYAPGTILSLRFIAFCDSVRSEGWYIDDVNVFGPPSGVAGPSTQPGGRPYRFALHPCRPNPSRGSTVISFCLPREGEASLKVYNIQGQLVRTLVAGNVAAGPSSIAWDMRDDQGRSVANGMYLYRLSTGTGAETRKMVVIK